MQTQLPAAILATSSGRRADEILRACVHCGFCNATCPTYLLTGDELDGPRGRIYLIKDMLEDAAPLRRLRASIWTAASRAVRAKPRARPALRTANSRRSAATSWRRKRHVRSPSVSCAVRWCVCCLRRDGLRSSRGSAGWFVGRCRTIWRAPYREFVRSRAVAVKNHPRRVVVLEGCVQRSTTPEVNAALARVLDAANVKVVRAAGETCCGSLELHLGQEARAHATMRANVDALYEAAADAEAIISTASGCGVTVKDYGRLLADDPLYADRARSISQRACDASEYLARIEAPVRKSGEAATVAWHSPCTLQHGQRVKGVVEGLLERAGYQLVHVANPHLCCGSAGTYSVLQHELADELRAQKLAALTAEQPDVIATANVGCQLHLRDGAAVPVRHWLELLG